MGATSSLCSGSKSVQVVNSTGRRPDRQPDGQTALNNARAPGVNQGSGLRLNNHGPALTESETKWIQQTNNNATRNKTNPSKRNDIAASGNNGAAETTDVVDRRQAANRRKEEGCNLSVYDNLPGSLGKLAVWGDNLDIEGSSSRYSAYKSSDGFGVDEYVDGYLVNQHTDLNHSDTSLLGSDSGDSWQLGGKILGNQQRGSSSSSQTSLRNPSLDNGNRSEVTSKHSSTSNNSSRLYRPGNKDFLSKGDYDNLPPLRSAVPDSDNLSVIGEVREADMKCASSNVQPDLFRPSRVSSAKCERVSNKENVSTLRQAKSLTLPLTPRSRPKSARKRDVSAKRSSERTDNGFSEGSASESGEDEVLSIPDETRGAGDHSDDLSDGLSGLGSTPDLALEALDSFPDSLAPTPLVSKEPTRQQRPPSFDIKSVLDDKGPPIGKKGSERSISGIVITQTDEGNTETNPRLKTLPPNTTLEEVGAMIAGDIIYRRSQGSMTQAEYRNIVKAYRIILEQLLAYQDENGKNKTPLTVKDKTNKTKQLESEKNSTPTNETQVEKDSPQYLRQEKQEKAASNTHVDGSPDRESPSSSDLDEKLDQVTSVFEEEFVQKLVERGSGLTEADITQYLTEHAQNVKGIKNVLETQKVKEVLSGNPEEMAALGPLQQRRLAMLDEVARLLYLFSADMATKDGTDLDELCEAILESLAPTPAEEPQPETVEEEGALFGAKVEQAMIELNDSFMRTVAYKRNEATAEELSHIIERHLIEETATVKRHELERLRTINNNLALLGKTSTGFHVKVPELDSRLDDMNKKRRKLEQALKRILLGRKPIGGEEISDILEKYRKEQRGVIEDRDVQRLKRRDDLKKKLVTKPEKKQPVKKKDILNEMKKRYEMKAKSVKQDKASAAFHALAAQKIVDSGSLSKESLTGLIKEHQRRVAELENVRRREQQRQIDANLRAVAQDKAEDERRNKERRVFLNRATDVKMRAEDVLASYRDATLQLHSLRPVHLPKSPRHLEENVPDSGYMDGTSADSTSVTPSVVTATPSIATATPISSPGPEYSHHYSNRLTPKRADDAESVRVEDYETFELLVNDVIDQCVDDYSRAENLYSWLVSQEVPSGHEGSHDGESPLFALSCIAKGLRSYADVFLEMTKLAGLNCEKVEGYTKTPAYSPGEDIFCDLYRHTWNAVYIDNRYFLLDASEGSRREKFFREHFFCTGPSIFALTHFPDNQRWQLMERLVTKEDFAFALKVWPAMFVYDIRPLNSRSLIRTYDGKMCITFSVKNHSVLCHLEYAGPGRAVDPRELGYHVDQHTNNVDHEESFHLTLPQEGVYFFTLLVNDPEDEFDLPVCQYRIDYQDELL